MELKVITPDEAKQPIDQLVTAMVPSIRLVEKQDVKCLMRMSDELHQTVLDMRNVKEASIEQVHQYRIMCEGILAVCSPQNNDATRPSVLDRDI
jgi:hypothetical protein